jgi:hypothetical protein
LVSHRAATIDGRLREDVIEIKRGHKVGGWRFALIKR